MVEPKARERAEEKEATTTYERDIAGGSITDDVRTLPVRGLAVTERPQRGRKNLIGEFHLSTRVRVRQRTEDGTDIYIILTYSLMLSIGY